MKQDMEIDRHLAGFGVRLSKSDVLARYGRAEASEDDPDDAMELQTGGETGFPGGLRGLANERQGKTPLQNDEKALQNARRVLDGQGDPSDVPPPPQIAKKRPSTRSAVIDAFVEQNSKAAKAVRAVVDNPSEGAFAQLLANLPSLMPTDPTLASVIADEMAKVYGGEVEKLSAARSNAGQLANSTDAQGNEITQEQAEKLYEEMMAK